MSPPPDVKTVVLCGGRGSRLRPLTDEIPKPLLALRGKPVLQHTLEFYLSRGLRRFVLCTGYGGDQIRDSVSRFGLAADIEYDDAGEGASMLQRLHHARPRIGDRAFVVYGDTYLPVDPEPMLRDHQESRAAVTLTTGFIRSPFGLVSADGAGWACSYEEKPVLSYFIGHLLIESAILDGVSPRRLEMPDGQGLVELLQELITRRRVRVHAYRGLQITFNTRQEYGQAERELISFFTHREDEAP